ncbi:hypothetical protein ACFFV7_45350 [Nonomuraea spiralis]|uniref:Uncharacterized protein n=1 Tax=Nonomuraea spiralis TaxID=46182 RepID=A0ABV5IX36_9ACTN|nr:hypothetical protein [Nonomuraea spiralis]GGS82808.1 hypothetical protein GCM10010176_027880 [Nonomuraea spiralis]
MKRQALLAAAVTVADLAGLSLGWWWVIPLAGLVVGAAAPVRRPVPALLAATAVAGAASLVWQGGARTLDAADLAGAMALNARGLGWVVVAVTLVYTLLLALAGAWIGGAARRLGADVRSGRAARLGPGSGSLDTKEDEHV